MKKFYETPAIEVVEIEVEKGFAATGSNEQMQESDGSWGVSPSNVWYNF